LQSGGVAAPRIATWVARDRRRMARAERKKSILDPLF
jgi:hypothetical protein